MWGVGVKGMPDFMVGMVCVNDVWMGFEGRM